MKSFDRQKLWASILIPLALAGAGCYKFQVAIANLVAMKPYPELLWAIFSAMGLGLLLALIAAWKVSRELRWVAAWELGDERARKALWSKLDRKSAVAGVYNLLTGSRNRVSDAYKEVLGTELEVGEERLFSLVAIASFVSGSLVGLGLLGTFIGLLGAIEDIARLISSLSVAGTGNIGALFGELVLRLKDPMLSMGTAFTASLFGLLGSLFLSYLCLMIKRGALQVIVNLRAMIRRADVFLQLAESRTYEDHLDLAVREATQWHSLFDELRTNYQGIVQDSLQTQIAIRTLVESNQQLADSLHERIETDQMIRRLLGEGVHWADALERMVEQTGRMRSETVGATVRVVESIRSLESTTLRAGERQPIVQDELHSALALIAARVGKLSQTLETQAQSVATYSEALLDSLQNHQLAIDTNNEKMRALLAAATDPTLSGCSQHA